MPSRTVRAIAVLIVAVAICPGPAWAQGTVPQKRFADWSIYRQETPQQIVCFAIGQGREAAQTPGNLPSYLYVTSWPRSGIKAEVSVRIGHALKAGAPATLGIGTDTFVLFMRDDRAYVDSPTDELRLLEAMKKGSQLQLRTETEHGAASTLTFSLSGLAAALQYVAQGCS